MTFWLKKILVGKRTKIRKITIFVRNLNSGFPSVIFTIFLPFLLPLFLLYQMDKTKTAAMEQKLRISTRIILIFKPIFLQPAIRIFFGWQIKYILVENDFGQITEMNQNFYGY